MSETKILDYNKQEVRDQLLRALRSHTKESTSADLALWAFSAKIVEDHYEGSRKNRKITF